MTTFYNFNLLVVGDCYIEDFKVFDHTDRLYEYCLDNKYKITEEGKTSLALHRDSGYVKIGKSGEKSVYFGIFPVKIIINKPEV